MKTAIITDFLNQSGGAEIVTCEIASLFPDADIFTLFADEEIIEKYFRNRRVFQHPKLKNSGWRRTHYRKLLPLYPTYIEDFDLTEYDLILSSSYLWAKGILCKPDALHISYVHTPMRQAWIKYHEYLYNEHDIGRFSRFLLRYVMNYIRLWDVNSANRVDHFIANSSVVKKRIEKIYRRDATVIYPPIKVNHYENKHENTSTQDYYITVGRLVPYKKVDLLVRAFNKLSNRKLIIVGEGNDKMRLEKMTKSKNIEFTGYISEERKTKLIAGASAFLFAAEEDFGMTPVEAMALGTPVIGFSKGGTQDYIKENINGLFFDNQTVNSLTDAVISFEERPFDRNTIAGSVAHFDETIFRQQFKNFVNEKISLSH